MSLDDPAKQKFKDLTQMRNTATGRPTHTRPLNGTGGGVRLALVLPTLREAANLPALLTRLSAALDSVPVPCEVFVVDDDSRDGTAELVRAFGANDPRVRLLTRQGERGLAGAVLHGWQHTDADLLGVMDADLQHPPELLPALVAAIEGGVDIAVGSRYVEQTRVQGWNLFRQVVSRVSTWVTLPFQRKVRVKDPMSGF